MLLLEYIATYDEQISLQVNNIFWYCLVRRLINLVKITL